MMKNKKNSLTYQPTYKLIKTDYNHILMNTGEEVEYFGFYKADDYLIANPPDHNKKLAKVLGLLRGTGISKITITFLDKNI